MAPPPPKPPNKPVPAAARRASLAGDGFQDAPARPRGFEAQIASLDRSKAIAGIGYRLSSWAEIPRPLTEELEYLTKSRMTPDEWLLLQRVILSSPAPQNPAEAKAESRRFLSELEGPLARLASSFHLRRLRESGAPISELYRGADIVLLEGGRLVEPLSEIGAQPGEGPFPGSRVVQLPGFGVLYFAPFEQKNLALRLEAPLAQMRRLAPQLMAFFEEHFVKEQNVGPLGCSPRTLRSGSPAKALVD